MAQGSSNHLVARVLWVAAAIFMLSAGVALAASDGGNQGFHKHAKLSDARALGGVNRCVRARAKRTNPAGVRRRCGRKASGPAEASRTPQPLYWGATIGSHVTGEQAPWDMGAVTKFEQEAGKSAS